MSITLSGLGSLRTVLENTVNAGPVPIDTSLTFSAQSGVVPIFSFASATLTVSGLLGQDRVGLQNLGAVTVAGAVVSFNGSPVGTLAGGTGVNFTIGFGTFGPVLLSTIEQVAEALVYSNASDKPTESRFLTLTLSAPGFSNGIAALEVKVTPENDAPVITSDNGGIVMEGIPTSSVVYVAEATDLDGDAITWRLGGPDAAQFEIDTDGRVRFVASPDFEAPTDVRGDNSYNFDVIASDGTTSVSRDVMIEVMNQVEQAAILDLPPEITFAEQVVNAEPQQLLPGVTFRRGEALDGLQLSVAYGLGGTFYLLLTEGILLAGSAVSFEGIEIGTLEQVGARQAILTLNGAATPQALEAFLRSLALSVPRDNPPATIAIELDLTNSGGQSQLDAPIVLTATIDPQNDAPILLGDPAFTVRENDSDAFATFVVADVDSTSWSFTLSGPDAALFRLQAAPNGVVFLGNRTPLDFEAPADADGDNIYQLTLQVSDGEFTDSLDVTVTIANEVERSLLLELDRFVALSESRELQRIDTAVRLTPGDRPDLLTVAGLLPEDYVSILPSGDGAGQIGFDGTTVRYEGIAIGTASGGAGTPFAVQFNAAATSEAAEALVEHLAYANTSDTPTGTRKLVVELVDSAGQTPGLPGPPAFEVLAMPGRGESPAAGAALADLDGDGTPELLLGRSSSAGIDTYRILPGPSLLPLTGDDDPLSDLNGPPALLRPQPVPALGDLDFDGDLDLLTGSGAPGVVAYAQTAAGFEQLTGAAYPFGALGAGVPAGLTDLGSQVQIAFGDWDGDGDDDILMVGNQEHAAFRNTGVGWLRVPADASPFAALAGIVVDSLGFMHLDGDGRLDLVVLRDNGPQSKDFLAFRNTGDAFVSISSDQNPFAGVMLSVSGLPAETPVRFAVGDVDGDGRTDLIALGSPRTYLLRNTLPLAEIELRVTPVNDAPTGPRVLDLAPLAEDTPRSITAQQLLAGWSDPEATPLGVSDLQLVFGGGTLVPDGSGGWLYTPGANDASGAVFGYLVSDGVNSIAATARLDLLPANDAPTGGVTHLYDAAARQLVALASLADADGLGAIAWRWQSFAGGAWTDLPGQTSARLSPWDLGVADLRLRAVASYTDGGGTAEQVAAASAVRVGGSGNTRFTVTDAAETILEEQGGGNDTVETALKTYTLPAEIETLIGTERNGQSLTGNTLANTIIGNIGNDSLDGGAGNDILNGGAGNDVLTGGPGVDRLIGGANDDTYFVGTGDVVVEQPGGGFDTVHVVEGVTHTLRAEVEALVLAGAGVRTGNGNAGDNTIQGNAINNVLSGLDGADTIDGEGGNDMLLGGNGADLLRGGAGVDVLIGNAGRDTLVGGSEADQFRFQSLADSTVAAPDLVQDFTYTTTERDRIALREIDANSLVGGRQGFAFIGGNEFAGVAGQLRVESIGAGAFLAEGDVDGDGVADFAIEIRTAATTPVSGWFLL
ncbi:cadherin-like domain-containing protein [Roseomonas sp. AR75]|uniref:cadherin-like domain-containing protein n=1 Tax=Roseomonas sp. AR75 TaxID=2562311 RepID=UPI0010C0B79C|nr:cadherin-like domain-containing protein [Roseomonas sp. AR75]